MSDVKNLNFIFSSFRKISRAYTDFLTAGLKDYDLTPNEIVVLSSLDSVSTASDIAKDSEVSKALVSRSVASLKEKQLIQVSISEVDKREQKLVLTDDGRRIAVIIDELNEDFARTAFSSLQENEKRVLMAIIKIVATNVVE
ncbi:MAG: winged helix-turn-helix transcriptional regulator [Clostridia bacterium]|nr:winged helix-turn-helix transcriptional regulator [Clostridia bacterium]